MENFNFIQWADLKTSIRGGANKLKDYEVSVYRNLRPKNPANCGNYLTLSSFLRETYVDDLKIRFGHINSKVVFQFNKVDGLNVSTNRIKNKTKGETATSRVASSELISMIYKSLNIKPDKNSYRLSVIDIGNNTFMIDSISK